MNPSRFIFFLSFFIICSSPASETDSVLQQAAAKIDRLISGKLEENKTQPNDPVTDEVFLRRIYLNVGGRIPTIEEAETFYHDSREDKRTRLIHSLLHSEAYVAHQFNFWADLLRLNNGLSGPAHDAYALWIKDSLRQNKPYDQFVRELVSARGHFWDTGATGYYFRDRGMPLENLANTTRIFLGTRLECAQCHDHPFDKWTQMDFYQMAAYTWPIGNLGDRTPNRDALRIRMRKEEAATYRKTIGIEDFPKVNSSRFEESLKVGWGQAWLKSSNMDIDTFRDLVMKGAAETKRVTAVNSVTRSALVRLYTPLKYVEVHETPGAELKLPHDYQYTDAAPFDVVKPSTMFAPDAASDAQSYGRWMTSPENPRFTKVIANRLWKKVFGAGLIEPVDEYTDHSQSVYPELLEELTRLMIDLDYDLKAFLEILYRTQAWQRATTKSELPAGSPWDFRGPTLRRMTAEQIWDSLVVMSTENADHYRPNVLKQLEGIQRNHRIYEALEGRTPEEFKILVKKMTDVVGDTPQRETEMRQEIDRAHAAGETELRKRLLKEVLELRRELSIRIKNLVFQELQGEIDPESLVAKTEGFEKTFWELPDPAPHSQPQELSGREANQWHLQNKIAKKRFKERITGKMVRASELRSPAPRGHFMRDFGQSDRDVIDNSNDGASVPQALNLLNSNLIENLTNPYGVLGQKIYEAETNREKARALFLGMLSREPNEQEYQLVEEELRRGEDETDSTMESVIWSLLNTQQFIFIR